jgi:hypothetical protein
MTNSPADLLGFRATVMRLTGLTDPKQVGIVGDGVHQLTGGYHEGKDVLVAIQVYHGPPTSHVGSGNEDYSARLLRDRVALTNDASAMDIAFKWPNGGNDAWKRFNNLLVADLKANRAELAAVRATNYSEDGIKKQRIDRQNGWTQESTSDTVDVHTHLEFYRDTIGKRQSAFDRLAQLITAAINNTTPEDDMPFLDDPNAAALAFRMDALEAGAEAVRGGPTKGEPMWLVQTVKALKVELDGVAAKVDQPAPVTLTDAQVQTVADKVTAQLGARIDQLAAKLDAVLARPVKSVGDLEA